MKNLILIALTVISAQVAHALEVGDQAPCVELTQIAADGTENEHCIRDRKFKGQPVVQEFFSVTCSDCFESFDAVNKVSSELEKQATFRLVAVDRDERAVRAFLTQNKSLVTHEVAIDNERTATKVYGVLQTPTIFLLNGQNTIVYKHVGVVDDAAAAALKKAILEIH
jgi:thiol-disulfide isomerase/thioredoxin